MLVIGKYENDGYTLRYAEGSLKGEVIITVRHNDALGRLIACKIILSGRSLLALVRRHGEFGIVRETGFILWPGQFDFHSAPIEELRALLPSIP